MMLTMEGSPFCFHWDSLAVKFLRQLPSHLTLLSKWAQLLQISTQTLPKINIAAPSSHFHLVASTRQIPSTCFTQESPLLLFQAHISTTHKDSSKNSAMVTIATDTFATSMQLYPRQPHLSRGTDLLMKTISIRLWHMESPTGLSQAPFKMRFPKVHYRTSSFCCLFISPLVRLSKHPPKDKQDFNRFREASSQIIFPFQRKFLFLEIASFFPPYSNPTPPSQSYMQF